MPALPVANEGVSHVCTALNRKLPALHHTSASFEVDIGGPVSSHLSTIPRHAQQLDTHVTRC